METVNMTTLLLGLITIMLGIIGFFLAKFYNRFEQLVDDFHRANVSIARHEERLENLEELIR
jgi:hypothetical protein